jgi:3-oxoacyl-[acyl-carrier-protein] synthase-1
MAVQSHRPGAATPMPALAVTAWSATTAVGAGRSALAGALAAARSGLRRNDFGPSAADGRPLPCWIGRVDGLEDAPLPPQLAEWECRNNRLAWLALQQDGLPDAIGRAIARHGAARVALVVGTSTASIGATEEGYAALQADGRLPRHLARSTVHTPHSLGGFLQQALGLCGPVLTVATACSSSAKVFAQAARLLRAGFADAALVGGVDTLCGSVLYGFNALELVSPEPCRPFDVARRGLSLGEAGGFALLERDGDGPRLAGYGESSDAHHMSAPHPEGLGARLAMLEALSRAGRAPADVDYINLHGTATPKNDEVEAAAVAALFPATTRASSTKGFTGHTLGAAGIVESVVALLALEQGLVPGTLHCVLPDPACGPQLALANELRECRVAMNNSFGFGGNNCALLFERG